MSVCVHAVTSTVCMGDLKRSRQACGYKPVQWWPQLGRLFALKQKNGTKGLGDGILGYICGMQVVCELCTVAYDVRMVYLRNNTNEIVGK